MPSSFSKFFGLLKDAGNEFSDDNATKLSASLAYYTIFAVGPLLLVIITLLGFFYKKQYVTTQVFDRLGGIIGRQGAAALQSMLQNISLQNHSTLFGVIGAIVLVFGATGIFTEIQTSINYIWSIRTKPKRSWLKYITDRLFSFVLILGLGVLMLVSLVVSVIIGFLSGYLHTIFGHAGIVVINGANIVLTFAAVTVLFTVVYKVLPDATIHWKDALVGAGFTGILFLIGKFLIGYYLGVSGVGSAFGAATSIILLLTWIYYSSLILYFGAEFTKVYAMKLGKGIILYDNAVYIIKQEAKELPCLKEVKSADSLK
jgi:membrane protein